MPQRPTHPRARPSTSPFVDAPPPVYDTFEIDSRVIHDRHGLGRVIGLNADRMDVRFGSVVMDIDTHSSKVHLL